MLSVTYKPGRFRRRFWTPYEQYRARMGQRFKVVRGHRRRVPGGLLYRVRFEDGTEIDAWGEEVCQGRVRF